MDFGSPSLARYEGEEGRSRGEGERNESFDFSTTSGLVSRLTMPERMKKAT
jgi:hypothetical protein